MIGLGFKPGHLPIVDVTGFNCWADTEVVPVSSNCDRQQLKGSVKEPNMFHNYETEKISRKASDAAEYMELFGSSARDRHARRI